jgi:hypothetical protein
MFDGRPRRRGKDQARTMPAELTLPSFAPISEKLCWTRSIQPAGKDADWLNRIMENKKLP